MRFDIKTSEKINSSIYSSFSRYLLRRMQKDISKEVRKRRRNYRVREEYILSSPLIKWEDPPPNSIDLIKYFDHCIELKYSSGMYYVQLNSYSIVKGSRTPVSVLIRILEYGTMKLPALQVVRKVFRYYSKNYQNLLVEYLKEEVL